MTYYIYGILIKEGATLYAEHNPDIKQQVW